MPILHAIVLGITQGLTEFLPVSSSGHLKLVPWFFGWDDFDGDKNLQNTFDVALHVGTLAGVLAYFGRDLWTYALDGLGGLRRGTTMSRDGRIAWCLVASTVPAAITGALLQDPIEEHLSEPWLIALMLAIFGLVLGWVDRLGGRRPAEQFGLRDALLMGTGQALALSPGVSRSGVTMSVSRFIGFDREGAARLSFLMSVPIIAGALVFKAVDALDRGIPDDLRGAMVAGIVASAVTGWLAVWGTLRFVRTRTFQPFVAYRLLLALAVAVTLLAGWR